MSQAHTITPKRNHSVSEAKTFREMLKLRSSLEKNPVIVFPRDHLGPTRDCVLRFNIFKGDFRSDKQYRKISFKDKVKTDLVPETMFEIYDTYATQS